MLNCQAPAQLLPMAAQWLPAVAAVDAAAQAHPWTQRQFADALASGYHGAMLVRHGEVLGFFVAMQAVDEVHLLALSVAPQHQGLGHGRCLLHALHEWARQVAAHTLWLEVRSSNARARSLYEGAGFVAVGQRKDYYPVGPGVREAAVLMCKDLCKDLAGGTA